MNDSVMELYQKLSINNKRNEFSSLLIKTDELVNELVENRNLDITKNVKNYDINKDSKLSEDEMLIFFYDDLLNIKNKLLLLLVLESQNKI